MSYLLDSNVFIQAKNTHYGMDFCPAFWEWLEEGGKSGTASSISLVQNELLAGNDEMADWAKSRESVLFKNPDNPTLEKIPQIDEWLRSKNYKEAGINEFMLGADRHLVAHALAHGHIVVTHELPSGSLSKVKVPDVCKGLGADWKKSFEMLRLEQARFVLQK